MSAIFKHFIVELMNDVPCYIYEMLILVALVAITVFFCVNRLEKALKFSGRLLLCEYTILVYSSTVFCRTRLNDIRYTILPFWSYKAYCSGADPSLLPEIVMNIVGFIPFGFLMGAVFQKLMWWQIILMGFLISVSIEILQYFFKLGVVEFDDVFHNTLGVAIGYGLYALTNIFLNRKRTI